MFTTFTLAEIKILIFFHKK